MFSEEEGEARGIVTVIEDLLRDRRLRNVAGVAAAAAAAAAAATLRPPGARADERGATGIARGCCNVAARIVRDGKSLELSRVKEEKQTG